MLDHVTVRATDLAASASFYATLLGVLGAQPAGDGVWEDFRLAQADGEHPATRRLHIGFGAPSRAVVDAFWQAGIEAGHRDDGTPGPRPQYHREYYGAFLLDPDGNSAEAVHFPPVTPPGTVDHLWIRVADLAAAKRFYVGVAPRAGLRLGTDTAERVQFRGDRGSFSLVPGTPSENVHLVFPRADGDSGTLRDPDGNTVEIAP